MGADKKQTTAEVKDVAETPAEVTKIKPTIEPKLVPTQVLPEAEFYVEPGNYHLVRLDPAGNEIPGSDFQIGAFNAEKSYIPLTSKFKVKKSPLK